MRLVTIMQFWLDVKEENGATPESIWQGCLDASGENPSLQDVAHETAVRLMGIPGVIKTQVIVASAEPITGTLCATFDQQRVDEERLLERTRG